MNLSRSHTAHRLSIWESGAIRNSEGSNSLEGNGAKKCNKWNCLTLSPGSGHDWRYPNSGLCYMSTRVVISFPLFSLVVFHFVLSQVDLTNTLNILSEGESLIIWLRSLGFVETEYSVIYCAHCTYSTKICLFMYLLSEDSSQFSSLPCSPPTLSLAFIVKPAFFYHD